MKKRFNVITRALLLIMISSTSALAFLGSKYVWSQYQMYQEQKAAIRSLDQSTNRALAKASSAQGNSSTVNVQQNQTQTIGVVIIPKIKVELPIFSDSSTSALDVGAGWIPESSPLGGGKGTHTVIDGHTGKILSLFTRIRELKKGDPIYLKVGTKVLEYRVTSKSTHDPTYVKDLAPRAGEDLLTLITCTPIYQNTNRLHVTAKRVVFDGNATSQKTWLQWSFDHPWQILGTTIVVLILFVSAVRVIRRQKNMERSG